MMVEHQFTVVYGVSFEEVSYLREGFFLGEPTGTREEAKQPPPIRHSYIVVSPPVDQQASPTVLKDRRPEDLGFVIPVVLKFRAPNRSLWNFTYEVLRQHPLAEFDQVDIRGIDGGEVLCELRLLFVPKLFNIDRLDL
jgi:hypothetical protein